MTAIVTNHFRNLNTQNFIESFASNQYYVFVGKSDAWSTDINDNIDQVEFPPLDTVSDASIVYSNMSAMKKLNPNDIIHMVPRINWTSGTSYVPWDSTDEDIYSKAYYVITNELKVYKCLVAGPGPSTVQPTNTQVDPLDPTIVQGNDGYLWKYMYTLFAADSAKFLTTTYMPIRTIVAPGAGDPPLNTEEEALLNRQLASENLAGAIYYIKVTSGGAGYTSAPTVEIDGDGTGASAVAVVVGGAVVGINVLQQGTDYNVAKVNLIGGGGTGATAVAILPPPNGHGSDPVKELGATYVAVNVLFDGAEGAGDFVVNNEFRQIGILKNPRNFVGGAVSTEETLTALKSLTVSVLQPFAVDDIITGSQSGAVAYVDAYFPAEGLIRYHQNEKTGFQSFDAGETITSNTGGEGSISTLNNPEYKPFSGEIVFIENRAPVDRTAQQIEDVKIIIEF